MQAMSLSGRSTALLGAVALSLAAAYMLVQRGPSTALVVAALPLIVLAAPALLTPEGRTVLLAAALVLPFSGFVQASQPLPVPGPAIYPQDAIVVLALGAALFSWLVARSRGEPFRVPWTPVLGWPFVVFAAAVVIGTVRGHYDYGATLFGQPLRLAVYAGIVVALVGMTPQRLYRLLLGLFYTGTVITSLFAVYYIATGTSQTDQFALSTGGSRILGISTSLYCGGALFLALLSVRIATSDRARLLHLTIGALAVFGVIAGFGRAAYVAVALVCVLLLLVSRTLRMSIAGALPLALPFLVLLLLFLPRIAPDLVESVTQRVASPPETDSNVEWRIQASDAVFQQIREQPLVGVGFGRESEFFVDVQSSSGFMVPVAQHIQQDPHNGYLLIWAGTGLVGLGSFLLVLGVFARDVIRRFRHNHDPVARLLVVWTTATLFAFLFNAASGTSFSAPDDLLTIWTLLVLPSVVPTGDGPVPAAQEAAPTTRSS